MAAQDHVRQFLAMDNADDVLDVRAEIDRAAHQMGAFAKSSQGRRGDLVPSLPQQPRPPLMAPPAMPRAVNQNKGGHGSSEISGISSSPTSARAISVGGASRPIALAALWLITSSYLVGACTGRSAGLSPLRMRSTYWAAERNWLARSDPYDIRPPALTK